jgi:hypothetical protein
VFSGGGSDGNVTRLCLEAPTAERTLALPAASGLAVTTGNREDLRR